MAALTVVPAGTYAPGTYPFGPVAVPVGAAKATLTVDVTAHLDPAVCWDLRLELSFDGGATWTPGGGATRCGGAGLNRDGTPATTAGFTIPLDQPANAARQGRGTVVLTGGSLTTSASLTLA